jgi:hypothetical protein
LLGQGDVWGICRTVVGETSVGYRPAPPTEPLVGVAVSEDEGPPLVHHAWIRSACKPEG